MRSGRVADKISGKEFSWRTPIASAEPSATARLTASLHFAILQQLCRLSTCRKYNIIQYLGQEAYLAVRKVVLRATISLP